MNIRIAAPVHRPLALALLVATLAPGMALAQTTKSPSAREQALEARVAELERQVQLLLSSQQQQQGQITQAQTQLTEVKSAQAAAPALPAGKRPIQLTSIVPKASPGTTFSFGGFIKADFLATRTGDGQFASDAVGRNLYLPGQTPVGGEKSGTDTNAHAKFSRINFAVDSVSEAGDKAGAMVEMDFFGNSLGNQTATNTYGTTIRHAYMYWNNWLAGQTWSNFMDVGALPEAVDFIGPADGVIFVRQAQLRYTRGAFSVALENPETTLIGASNSDRGAVPDLTLRYGWKGGWGSFGIAALVRQLKIDNTATGEDDSKIAGGLTLGGKWVAGDSDSLFYQFTGGQGIARYIGLGITQDAVVDASDGSLDATGVLAGYVGWRHQFTPKLRTNLIYSRSDYDNDVALTGNGVTKSVHSIRGNVFYTPFPKIDIGAELMYGKREIESGQEGDISRLQFTTKYSF
jgi:hypothetical protein